MKLISLYIPSHDGLYFYLHKWLGMLLVKKNTLHLVKLSNLPRKYYDSYQKLLNPFTLTETKNYNVVSNSSKYVLFYAKILVFLCKRSFFLARLFLMLPFRPSFKNTQEAIAVFRNIFPGDQQRILCLPRVFFAAATSQSFKKSGVGFIGVFLPSRNLHAWIIEGDSNPDPYDDIWVCYKPVAAIT